MKKAFRFILLGVFLLGLLGFFTLRAITPGADKRTRKVEILAYEDLDGDGKHAKDEMPLPNTLVLATTNVHGNFTQSVLLTDAAGKASIEAEYTHYFDIHALTPCGYTNTTRTSLSALDGKKHEFGFQPVDGKIASSPTRNLVFALWQDTNRDGIRQPAEPALSGVDLAFGVDDNYDFYNNEFSVTTGANGKATLNVGNSCGVLTAAPVDGWDITAFSQNYEIKENGTLTFEYNDTTHEISWGLSKYESFSLTVGNAHHPEGMGQWDINFYANGVFSARHNVFDETTKYGPYTLTDQEVQELWLLVAAAEIESLPRTFERPGVPDETAYEFSLHTINEVYLVEMWVDDAENYPNVQALVERMIELMETYTGQEY